MSTDRYSSPLSERYASKEMQYIFSQDMKFSTWRKLWIALAETEMELGLSENGKPVITQEQIDEMKEHVYDINYDVAKEREKLVRHVLIPSNAPVCSATIRAANRTKDMMIRTSIRFCFFVISHTSLLIFINI